MDKRILLLKEIILSKIQSSPTIEELSTHINISPSRLRQLFKSETGMPFGEYVRHLQLEYARELLETTFMRVQEIRVACGFHNQNYFNRVFKEKYKLTPQKYRQKNHEELKNLQEKS